MMGAMAWKVKVGWFVERFFCYVESLQDLGPCLDPPGEGL